MPGRRSSPAAPEANRQEVERQRIAVLRALLLICGQMSKLHRSPAAQAAYAEVTAWLRERLRQARTKRSG